MRTYRQQRGKLTINEEDEVRPPIQKLPPRAEKQKTIFIQSKEAIPEKKEEPKPATPAAAPAVTQQPPKPADAKPSTPPAKPEAGNLSRKEIEELASKLATEQVKNLQQVADPFDAWEKAREQILARMLKDYNIK